MSAAAAHAWNGATAFELCADTCRHVPAERQRGVKLVLAVEPLKPARLLLITTRLSRTTCFNDGIWGMCYLVAKNLMPTMLNLIEFSDFS